MDRRQRKTREAIFHAFAELLSKKEFHQITVGDIIDSADVGRATFYAHFETKDFLLKAFCEELFCHILDTANDDKTEHRHIFDCDGSDSVFLHIVEHLQKNDNNILALLSSRNNALFLSYFKKNLEQLLTDPSEFLTIRKRAHVPDGFWKPYVVSTFLQTLMWWIDHGMKESPETITAYFLAVVS